MQVFRGIRSPEKYFKNSGGADMKDRRIVRVEALAH